MKARLLPLLFSATLACHGAIVVYTFESQAAGTTTPLSYAPESGSFPGFTTTFTSSVPGESLFIADGGPDGHWMLGAVPLTLTFSHRVTALALVFATAANPGRLMWLSPAGGGSADTTIEFFPDTAGGYAVFIPGSSFDTITLMGFDAAGGGSEAGGGPAPWGLDNLALDVAPVPEPSTLSLAAIAALGCVALGLRRRRQPTAISRISR
jgi:hypothetical protein